MHSTFRAAAWGVITLMAAAVLFATQPAPLPGYWRAFDSAPETYIPCNGTVPYIAWTNPEPTDPTVKYLRGDGDIDMPAPNLYGTAIDAGFGNHTTCIYDFTGLQIPVHCEPITGPGCTINYYPAPATVSQLCTQWTAYGNTTPCPSGSLATYSQRFKSQSVWQLWFNSIQARMVADCTLAPPTPTPTPSPNPQAAYIEAIYHAGITAGCGPTIFCPNNPMTRGQNAVWFWNALHPGLAPPPCVGIFSDVPCINVTPTPHP